VTTLPLDVQQPPDAPDRRLLAALLATAAAGLACGLAVSAVGYVWLVAAGLAMTVGVAWPWVIVRATTVTLAVTPSRPREGESITVFLQATTRWPIVVAPLRLVGDADLVDAAGNFRAGDPIEVELCPTRFGPVPKARLRFGSQAPFGLWRASRDVTVLADAIAWPRTRAAGPVPDVGGRGRGDAVGRRVGQGGETCGGGLHMIDIRQPKNPTFAGCFQDFSTGRQRTGYSHDAQCVIYRGPDEDHQGKEICFGSNETALSIADVTDKENTVALSTATYPNVAYSHQGWVSEDHAWFFMNDELDEMGGGVSNTRTLVWDISDLDDPILANEYFHETRAIDHNLYVDGNTMYQSNYTSGLRVLDVSDPANPVKVGHFDTVPYGGDQAEFNGSWSNFPYFESGIVVVTSQREGLFIVRYRPRSVS